MGHTVMGQVICMEYYVEPDLQFNDETEMDTWVWDVPLLLEPELPPVPAPRSDELQSMLLQAVEPDPAWTLFQESPARWVDDPATPWMVDGYNMSRGGIDMMPSFLRQHRQPPPPPPPPAATAIASAANTAAASAANA